MWSWDKLCKFFENVFLECVNCRQNCINWLNKPYSIISRSVREKSCRTTAASMHYQKHYSAERKELTVTRIYFVFNSCILLLGHLSILWDLTSRIPSGEMAACNYSKYVGGACGTSTSNPRISECVLLTEIKKDIKGHLKSVNIRDSTLQTEAQLLLARAGKTCICFLPGKPLIRPMWWFKTEWRAELFNIKCFCNEFIQYIWS